MRTASLLVALAVLAPSAALAQPLVVLDPGHGGADPGAVGCSLEEEDVVLDVALRLRTSLEAAGVRVALTRDDDASVGLSARAAFANSRSADAFVSVHSNANSGTPATGTETWIANAAGARSLALAQGIQDEMVAAWSLADRGVKRADFVVVRDTDMPSALAEIAFTNRCSPDAALMSDPDERQRLAEAQARAVLAWLGIEPGTMREGELRGVVFEDQGVGTEDLSVRLPGATVRVMDASATAAEPDGGWVFTLPPGSYTVEASAAGHVTASRTCEVMAGATTWCSVGLAREAAGSDAGPPVALDAGVEQTDASTAIDAAAPDGGEAMARPTESGCACRAGGRSASGASALSLLLLVALVLVARRRSRAPRLALAALVVLGCGAPEASVVEAPLSAPDPSAASAIERAHEVASLATLGEEREWLAAELTTPQISPDARHVALSSLDFGRLFVVSLEGAPTRTLCQSPRCAYEPRWQDDGAALALRSAEQSATAIPNSALLLDGTRTEPRVGTRGVHAWTDDDDRVHFRDGHTTRVISRDGDRYLAPQLSPDGRYVVYWGLSTGLWLHRVADGARVALGEGGHPRFDPSGRALVFERTTDDGHALVSGALFVARLDDGQIRVAPLATRRDGIARMPSLSRVDDRGRAVLAFLRDGALVVAPFALDR